MLRHAHSCIKGGLQTFAASAKSNNQREESGRSGYLPEFSVVQTQRMAAQSPICEFGIVAARARSKENAAIAKSSVPPRGGKTGHSCKAQQDKSVELTDCGQRVLSLRLRQ
jgi:hypothetical protein